MYDGGRRKKGSKTRRRNLRQKEDMAKGSTSGGVTGGKAISGDLWPGKSTAWAKWKQFSSEERERVGGEAAQEGAAGKDGIGEIDVAFVFGHAFGDAHRPDGGLGEIEDKETGENLLEDEFRFLCVKMDEAYGVFQAAEGGLDAPAPGVESFECGEGELVRVQVGDKGFRISAASLQTDNTEGYFIEIRAIRF